MRVGSTPCRLELQEHRGDSAVRGAGSAGTVESAQEAELETELGERLEMPAVELPLSFSVSTSQTEGHADTHKCHGLCAHPLLWAA